MIEVEQVIGAICSFENIGAEETIQDPLGSKSVNSITRTPRTKL
jgi:hypothetical protein